MGSRGTEPCIYTHLFFPNSPSIRAAAQHEQTSMCYTVGPCWLSPFFFFVCLLVYLVSLFKDGKVHWDRSKTQWKFLNIADTTRTETLDCGDIKLFWQYFNITRGKGFTFIFKPNLYKSMFFLNFTSHVDAMCELEESPVVYLWLGVINFY